MQTTGELFFICLQKAPAPSALAPLAALTPAQWAELAGFALEGGVAPLFYHRLRQQGLDSVAPAAALAHLQGAQQKTTVRNLRLYHDLQQVVAGLHAQQIPVILLKGAYLAGVVYEQIGLRPMVDMDLLVPVEQLAAAVSVVTQLGYQPLTPLIDIPTQIACHHHLPRFVRPGGASVEIHWTITRPGQSYSIAMPELWQRARPATVAGVEVLGLCPEDLLLHVCLHATYQHMLEQGLRFLGDIAAICERFADTFEWAQFTERAQRWGWARGVYLALRLAADLVQAAVPPPVLQALQPDQDVTRLATEAQVWLQVSRSTLPYPISRDFSQLWQTSTLTAKAGGVLQRLFLPRALMASYYAVPIDSLQLYLYYPVRLAELLVRYSGILYNLWRKPVSRRLVKKKAALAEWLSG